VQQEEAEIGLLQALNDPVTSDLWACAHLKFLRDLFHATPSECLMVRMLGRLEPVCIGETVDERQESLEEYNERVSIYATHVEAQAALVADRKELLLLVSTYSGASVLVFMLREQLLPCMLHCHRSLKMGEGDVVLVRGLER